MEFCHLKHHAFRRMLLIALMVVMAVAKMYAQQTEKKLNIQLTGATLEEFIRAMEKATEYSFVYSEDVRVTQKITLKLRNKTLEEVLKQVFEYEPVKYKISGQHILLQKTKPKPKPVGRRFTISGYINDGESLETLIGANVFESGNSLGTTSNSYGFYTITLPEGKTKIGFSYLGYASQSHGFILRKDTTLNIRLTTDNVLDEVVVLSDRVEVGLMSTHTGALEIPMAQIKNTPVILGESDVMKTIQMTPGVQSGIEGSAGLYVRGGSPDQNLVLLDGVPIYNVDHVLGFFSIFTPEAVKKVTLFKSSFPARFGGRLSSVVDVRTNDGNMKSYHGSLSLGLLTSKLSFEGPIIKDRTSFNISLRRTYLDLLTRPFLDDDSKVGYYFYDINTKLNHKFSDKNRLFLSFYHGKDYLNSEYKDEWGYDQTLSMTKDEIDVKWGNTVLAARWNNIINNKLFSNTTISYNRYTMNMDGKSQMLSEGKGENYHTDYNSGIRDFSGQIDFDYTPTPKHHIKFGGGYTFHQFKPEVKTTRISSSVDDIVEDDLYQGASNSRINAHEMFAYVEDNFDLTDKLRTNIGLHLSSFSVQGKTYLSLQPRLAARYQLRDDLALKASYSQMSQYINLLTSAPISMPTDLWVPVTKNLKPMRSHQYTIGTYYTGFKGWELSVEGYYKQMNNILEYKDATRFIGSSASWEEKVEMGKGRSFGAEFMLQRTVGKTTGWLSYTWAKSDRKFDKGSINNGERFPFKYDRRHQVNLVVNHRFNDRIDVGASWFFATGTTTTVSQGMTSVVRPYPTAYSYYLYVGDNSVTEENFVQGRNNYRLPASHRLNIGINFHKKTKHGVRTWNISVYNVYNAMNPTFVHRTYKQEVTNYPNYDGSPGRQEVSYTPVFKKLTLLPCIPSVTYTYRF